MTLSEIDTLMAPAVLVAPPAPTRDLSHVRPCQMTKSAVRRYSVMQLAADKKRSGAAKDSFTIKMREGRYRQLTFEQAFGLPA
jgi:hypothetical protein